MNKKSNRTNGKILLIICFSQLICSCSNQAYDTKHIEVEPVELDEKTGEKGSFLGLLIMGMSGKNCRDKENNFYSCDEIEKQKNEAQLKDSLEKHKKQ